MPGRERPARPDRETDQIMSCHFVRSELHAPVIRRPDTRTGMRRERWILGRSSDIC